MYKIKLFVKPLQETIFLEIGQNIKLCVFFSSAKQYSAYGSAIVLDLALVVGQYLY